MTDVVAQDAGAAWTPEMEDADSYPAIREDARQAEQPAESAAETAEQNQAVDGVAETEAVEQTEAEKAEQAEQAAKQSKEDKTPAWQKREMAIERDRRRQAEQRAAELEARLAQLEQGQRQSNQPEQQQRPQSQASAEGAPRMDDPKYNASGQFDALAFMNDLTDWRAEQKVSARFSEWEAKQEQQRQAYIAQQAQREADARRDAVLAREDELRAAHDDYDQAVAPIVDTLARARDIGHPVFEILTGEDNAPDLIYYLGQNPKEFASLLDMNPRQIYKALGTIEAKISTPKQADTQTQTQRQSPPKPPPKGVDPLKQIKGGTAIVSREETLKRLNDASEDADEFNRAYNESRKKARR